MDCSLGSGAYVAMIDACIFQLIYWIVSMIVAPMCSDNVGYLEYNQVWRWVFSGMCFIQNMYMNNFSLKANRWVFFMFSRTWSENIFTSGWWSIETSKSGHPNINILQNSNLNISARASPSTGELRDSASFVNRNLAKIIFQWFSPQFGPDSVGHWLCFWKRKYLMLVLLLLVERHVALFILNVFTPSLIFWTMFQMIGPNCFQ